MRAGAARLARNWFRRHRLDVAVTAAALLGAWGVLAWRRTVYETSGLTLHLLDDRGRQQVHDRAPPFLQKAPPWLRKAEWKGWIWVPRHGKYVFGTSALGRARLEIDGAPLLEANLRSRRLGGHMGGLNRDWRIAKEQREVARGWHLLHLTCQPEAQGGCRLLWQPPGRRGDPEYVDTAFLRPEGPRPATQGPERLPRRDAWAATALLLLGLTCLLVWMRRPLRALASELSQNPTARRDALAAAGLVATGLAVRLAVLGRFGQTWDEDVYFGAGRNYVQNLLSLDFSPASWIFNYEHPPVTKYLAGYGTLWTEDFTGPRLVMALVSSLALGFGYAVGRRLVGRTAAALGMLAAAFDPHLAAHGTIVGHEAPTALFVTATLWAVARAMEREGTWQGSSEGRPGTWYLLAGLLAGLSIGTRWVNAAVVLVWVSWWLAKPRLGARGFLLVPWGLLAGLVLAGLVPLLVWPRLWHGPTYRIGQVLTYYTPWTRPAEAFLGRVRPAPWYYFGVYLSAALPTAVVTGMALWTVTVLLHRSASRLRLGLWALLPVLVASASPLKQDGVRYVIASYVPLYLAFAEVLVLAARAAARKLGPASRPTGWRRLAAGLALAAAAAAPPAWSLWVSFPYGLDSYNLLWGGCRGAFVARRLEWSWWGEGLEPCWRWLNRRAPRGARVAIQAAARHMSVPRPDLRIVRDPSQADFVVQTDEALRRPVPRGFRVAHEERAGRCPVARVLARLR